MKLLLKKKVKLESNQTFRQFTENTGNRGIKIKQFTENTGTREIKITNLI